MSWENVELRDVSEYRTERIETNLLNETNYVSTENMLSDKGGIVDSSYPPSGNNSPSFKANDTLVSNIRPYFKKIWFAQNEGGCSNDVIVFKPNEEKINPKFLYFQLSKDEFFDYMMSGANGTKMPRGNKKAIPKFKFSIPTSLETQKRIASILSTYDDLIENNLKRIKLLEETAQNIYKEWFVNFRFPNYEHTEFDAESGLPVGWEIQAYSRCADFINGFAFKPHHHSENGLPIIKIKELKGGINNETPRYNGEDVPDKYFFGDETILFSWSADINVYWWTNGDSILNQHLFKVVPFENVIKEHFYFGLKNSVPEFMSRANGSTMKHIKRSELDTVYYTKPTENISKMFQKQVKPILKQIVSINSQNQKLKEARDILLPRLMNRTIAV